jgi:hypothetical protein
MTKECTRCAAAWTEAVGNLELSALARKVFMAECPHGFGRDWLAELNDEGATDDNEDSG